MNQQPLPQGEAYSALHCIPASPRNRSRIGAAIYSAYREGGRALWCWWIARNNQWGQTVQEASDDYDMFKRSKGDCWTIWVEARSAGWERYLPTNQYYAEEEWPVVKQQYLGRLAEAEAAQQVEKAEAAQQAIAQAHTQALEQNAQYAQQAEWDAQYQVELVKQAAFVGPPAPYIPPEIELVFV